MNSSNVIGRLVATPELKKTQSGKSVTSFTVAVNRRKKKGEEQEADYIDCVAWSEAAELITKWFDKGSMIGVTGRLQTRLYEDKNGKKIKATEIVVAEVTFCEKKKESASPSIEKTEDEPQGRYDEVPDDDDLPF